MAIWKEESSKDTGLLRRAHGTSMALPRAPRCKHWDLSHSLEVQWARPMGLISHGPATSCGLTIHSSRNPIAAFRLNSGVGPMPRLLIPATCLLLCCGAQAQDVPSVQKLTANSEQQGQRRSALRWSCITWKGAYGRPGMQGNCAETPLSLCQGFCEAPFGTEVGAKTVGKCSKEGADRAGGCSNLVEQGRSTRRCLCPLGIGNSFKPKPLRGSA